MNSQFPVRPDEPVCSSELKDLDEQERGLIEFPSVTGGNGGSDDHFLATLEDAEGAEKMLAAEIDKLTLVEHEKIMFDVHGIAQMDQEDPEGIDGMLVQVEAEVNKIRSKVAYNRAKYLDENYVNDRSFRLRFLRCDRFDCKLAAQRLVRHFEVKQGLFGEGDVLARDVRLSDMSEKDMLALEAGFIQVLPSRDAGGRSIFSIAPMHRPTECSVENCGRAMWYIFNTTMKDEETQHKGIVGILSNFGEHARKEPLNLIREIQRMRTGIPKKIVGFHYCYDDHSFKPFVAGIGLFLAKEMRARFRPHFGDRENIAFELQTYGIPTNDHPILPNGILSLEWHKEWLKVCRTQEESESTKDGMIIPRRFDVLFGRGKNTREHTGNLRAAHLVEMHQREYEKAGKFEKTEIAERIVSIINESLGRFLKWEENGWAEVDNDAAREKISHFFRHLRSKVPAKGDSAKSGASSITFKRVTPCPSPTDDDGRVKGSKQVRDAGEEM